jgi:hypothetical protein
LTSGKFWASGAQVWRSGDFKYVSRKLIDEAGQKNASYFSTWDLTRLENRRYNYFPDSYMESYGQKHDSLKPCLLNSMQNYLDASSQEFLMALYSQASRTMKTHCNSNFWHAFAFLTTPGHSVSMHCHDVPESWPSLSFTYVVSSNHSTVQTSYINTILDNGQLKPNLQINFPNTEKFYMVHDSTIPHGARSSIEDKNTYLYFIFDGVTPKSYIELDRFYESNP